MGKAGVGVGQVDDGGEVQVGDDHLHWQAGQRCQAHVQLFLGVKIESECAITILQLFNISTQRKRKHGPMDRCALKFIFRDQIQSHCIY